MRGRAVVLAAVVALAPAWAALAAAAVDVHAMFEQAAREARLGLARKTIRSTSGRRRPARSWSPRSPARARRPGARGRSRVTGGPQRCPATGNEAILVSAAKFAERYEGPMGPGCRGLAALPAARHRDAVFRFAAGRWQLHLHGPLGRAEAARPGDAIVRSPQDPADTYRIAAAAFACTYEILRPAP